MRQSQANAHESHRGGRKNALSRPRGKSSPLYIKRCRNSLAPFPAFVFCCLTQKLRKKCVTTWNCSEHFGDVSVVNVSRLYSRGKPLSAFHVPSTSLTDVLVLIHGRYRRRAKAGEQSQHSGAPRAPCRRGTEGDHGLAGRTPWGCRSPAGFLQSPALSEPPSDAARSRCAVVKQTDRS